MLAGTHGDAPLEAVAIEDEAIGGSSAEPGDLINEMILGDRIVEHALLVPQVQIRKTDVVGWHGYSFLVENFLAVMEILVGHRA